MRNTILTLATLLTIGLVGGCHYGSYDDHRGYGYSGGSGVYREGFRDGRAYERRRDAGWGYSRYDDRYYRR